MSKPMIRVHDLATNKVIDREMNDAEFSQWELNKANVQIEQATVQAAEAAKAAQKQAVLDRLGLTAEEAQLLLGGN